MNTVAEAVKAFSALGIAVAALWTVYVFLLQRSNQTFIRLEIDSIDSRLRDTDRALLLRVRATNISRTGVGKSPAWLELSSTDLQSGDSDGPIRSYTVGPRPTRIALFVDNSHLEPGERISGAALSGSPK